MKKLNPSVFEQIKYLQVKDSANILIIKGPAGTGKTTLIKKLIDWVDEQEIGTPYLLATTGRAAKILRDKTGNKTETLHHKIYTFSDLEGEDDSFELKNGNELPDKDIKLIFHLKESGIDGENPIYFVDESSMISDTESVNEVSFANFGSGKVLSDFMEYASDGKIVFVGDEFQLPPVNDSAFSPALNADYLQENFNTDVDVIHLNQIHRFAMDGFIYFFSELFRNRIKDKDFSNSSKPNNSGDIRLYSSFKPFFNAYYDLIKDGDFSRATYICPSNKIVGGLNRIVRDRMFPGCPKIQVGDLLLVTQNSPVFGFYNGDLLTVKEIGPSRVETGLTMLSVKVEEIVSKEVSEVILIEELLYGNLGNLDKMQYQRLMIAFSYRMKAKGIKPRSKEYLRAMVDDQFLNALRVKFGYALTCHKAQGGEWPDVFIRTANFIDSWPHPKGEKWKYTAITRASERIHLIKGSLGL